MKRKPNESELNQIKLFLEYICKWHLESAKNIQEQYFGIQASQFVTNYIHELSVFMNRNNLEIDDDEWVKLYMEASDKARKDFFEGCL